MRKAMSIVALVGAAAVAATKLYQGEMPSLAEVMLAVTGVAAAFGFQK